MKNPVNLVHALLASSGFGAIADSLVNLHGAAQAGGFGVGVIALAVTAVSLATHSRHATEIAHQLALDESKVVTPGVVDRLRSIEESIAKFVPLDQVAKMLEDAVGKVEAQIPAPARVAIEDVRPLVEDVLAPVQPLLDALAQVKPPAPAAAEPAAAPAPAPAPAPVAPVVAAPAEGAPVPASPPVA